MKWWLSVTFNRPLFVFCTLQLITSYLCFKSLLAMCILQIKGCKRGIIFRSNSMSMFSLSFMRLQGSFSFYNTPSFFMIFFPLQRTITFNNYFLVSPYLFDDKTPLYSRGLKLTLVLNTNVRQAFNIYFFAIDETQL